MDEELQRWAKAWQSMEVKHVSIMKRAQAAHRFEAMWQGVLAAILGAGVLFVAMTFKILASVGWHQVLIAVLTLAFTGWALWRSRQQATQARARLVATPLGFVTDLIDLRERELFWWVDKRVLLAGGVLVLAGHTFAIDVLVRFRAAGEPRVLSEGLMGFALLGTAASVVFGIWRVRYLRRELTTLRELRSELEAE